MPTNGADAQLNTLKQVLNITFNRNLAALEKYFPNFFHRYKDYTPQFAGLEMDEKGFLNIAANGKFIYDDDPQKVCRDQLNAFGLTPVRTVYNLGEINPDDAPVFFEHIEYIHQVVQAAKNISDKEEHANYEIPSCYPFMLVIGVGMGYHLEYLANENIQHLYIYEPNDDIFYASLFVTDYASIIDKFTQVSRGITIEVGATPETFSESLHSCFIQHGPFKAAAMPVFRHYNSDKSKEALTRFYDGASRYYSGFGFFEDEMISLKHNVVNLHENKPFIPAELTWKSEIADKPVFICANGPSLDNCIEFLQNNRDSFYLFSCGSALYPLFKAGLTPDLHFEIERTEDLYEWVAVIDDEEFFKNVPIVCMSNVAPKVMNLFGEQYLFLKPNDAATDLLRFIFPNECEKLMHLFGSNPLVGNGAVAFAANAGFKKIYFAGLDAGFKDVEYHHSKSSAYYHEFEGEFNTDHGEDIKIVEGNFSEEIYTNHIYDASRHGIEYILRREEFLDIDCYNCSDGAKIERAKPQPIEELKLPKLENKLDLRQWLKDHSISEPFDIKVLEQKLADNKASLFAELEILVRKEFADAEPTLNNIIEIFNFQFNHVKKLAETGRWFEARMISGSLTYVQAASMGKLYLMYKESSREEYIKEVLRIQREYFLKLKEVYNEAL